MTRCHPVLIALAVVLRYSTPAGAQPLPAASAPQPPAEALRATPANVVSANPFGLLVEFVNTEYRTADRRYRERRDWRDDLSA